MPYFIKYFNNCNTSDDLPCILYTKKNKTLRFLPPTSNMSRGDDLRTLCCFKLFKLISAPDTNLNLLEFFIQYWCTINLSLHYQRYTLLHLAARKMHWKMSVLQVWRFMHKILQVQRRRVFYLNLPIDSVWHGIKYANIRVFFKPNFPVYRQNPRMYTGKYVSERTRIFAYFTQCDVFHLLAQKRTNYWTRIIDIILL